MLKKCFILGFCIGLSIIAYGQSDIPDSLVSLFHQQLAVFPQEKIYVHTDKPYYISGEQIWFRAYLTDAVNHFPATASRYVYVELIDPLDSIVGRVKIMGDEAGTYHGFLPIPEDVPEGDYMMRAYTRFMQNLDENYFWHRAVHIGDPQSRAIHTEADFSFTPDSKDRVDVTFRFSRISYTGSSEPFAPQSVNVSVNHGKPMNIKVDDDGETSIHFNLSASSRNRIILLEAETSRNPYRKFIRIPTPDNDYDVSFYPEGGSLMQGAFCRLAFKALKSNGQATHISGIIYDQTGTEVRTIKSDYLGMGSFLHAAEKGKSYYLVCQNDKGQTKRFDLPEAVSHGYALSVIHAKNKIYVSIQKPDEFAQNDELYLLAHTRGLIHYADHWDNNKNLVVIGKEQLPSGVLHIILFDAGRNPLSERLVFINNHDRTKVAYQPDNGGFAPRSLVRNHVTVTDSDGEPVTGSFSVSVTSDKEVSIDSTSNILTQLLLSSDLRGTIENPTFYFRNNYTSAYALDLLMLTQGWRRYDIAGLAQGRISSPTIPIETGAEITGTVKTLFQGKPVEGIEVALVAVETGFFDNTKTDAEGRFYMYGIDLPDSVLFAVSAEPTKGMTRTEIFIDSLSSPDRTLPVVPLFEVDRYLFAEYADKAEQKFTEENGMRMYNLPEVVVSAERKPAKPSQFTYYSIPSSSIKMEELGFTPVLVSDALATVPGVFIKNGNISIRGAMGNPIVIIDDVVRFYPSEELPINNLIEYIEDLVPVHEIAQIDVLKEASNLAVFGVRGANGAISIYTKRGEFIPDDSQKYNVKAFMPLGFQPPVEFYAPKYDTPESRENKTLDLRTTIYWQPVVQTDSLGVASFEFYAADEETSYSVVIEGLTNNGKIIRQYGKLGRED